jgi:mono/diheme cytochrome c family protein
MADRGWARVGKLLVAILAVAIVAAAAAAIVALRSGISARTAPTATEAMIATAARRFAIPVSARQMRNPIPLTSAAIAEGRDHFADHCATCHANDGSGKTDIGTSLYPAAPDMRRARTQELSDGELFYIIKNGVRLTGMPAWGDERDDADNWKLVHFIRHLPKITPQELDEMRKMNPVSPHERMEQEKDEEFLKGH